MGGSLVLVPVDAETNVELVTQAAMAAAPGAEIEVLDVTRNARSSPRRVNDEQMILGYAQLRGVHAIVVERNYGTSKLWRNTSVVARLARTSPVPVLALPSGRRPLERWAARTVGRVLAAVDSTVASAVALRTSIAFAGGHQAGLTIFHALENFPGYSVFSGSEAWRVVERLPARQRQIAEWLEARARQFGRADAAVRVMTGDPAAGIVRVASENDAGVIVMGVAPRAPLGRSLFGSTLDRVLRRAGIPVLVVPVSGGAAEWRGDPQRMTARIAA